MRKFKIGDVVKVKPGVKDPDYGHGIGGWHGRVVAISDEPDNFIGVEWDSVTLKSMPDQVILQSEEDGYDWMEMYLGSDEVEPADARDSEEDVGEVQDEIIDRLELDELSFPDDFDFTLMGNFLFDDEDSDYDEIFDLEAFFEAYEIPEEGWDTIVDCLTQGVENYYLAIYGHHKYGKQPEFLTPERMHEPYIFGYGALEAVRAQKVSVETKLKIVAYTLAIIDPPAEYGVPHGLLGILSFLAGQNQLEAEVFRGVMQAIKLGGSRDWVEDWEKEEAAVLSDWLFTNPDVPNAEKLWWLWYISMRLNKAHFGKFLINYWLEHEALPLEVKRDLCWAWYTVQREPAGEPPPAWRLMDALFAGNEEKALAILEEIGIDPDAPIAPEELGLEPDALDESPEELPGEDAPLSLGFVRNMLAMGLGGPFYMVSPYIRRQSMSWLVRLGEDPLTVCEMSLGKHTEYYTDALNQGVADVIQEFGDQIPDEEIRKLVDKAIDIPRVKVRKTFYELGTELFGKSYLERALDDNAASVRKWARKQLDEA